MKNRLPTIRPPFNISRGRGAFVLNLFVKGSCSLVVWLGLYVGFLVEKFTYLKQKFSLGWPKRLSDITVVAAKRWDFSKHFTPSICYPIINLLLPYRGRWGKVATRYFIRPLICQTGIYLKFWPFVRFYPQMLLLVKTTNKPLVSQFKFLMENDYMFHTKYHHVRLIEYAGLFIKSTAK